MLCLRDHWSCPALRSELNKARPGPAVAMSSSTPSIRISHHQRYASPPSYSSNLSANTPSPMAVPRAQEPVPPPLPPPTIIPELASGRDPGWQWGNDPNSFDFGRAASVKPGSSLLGGSFSSRQEKEFDYTRHNEVDDGRRGSSIATITGTRRDHDMTDDNLSHSDEDGPSRRASNYRYVRLEVMLSLLLDRTRDICSV